VTPSRRRGAARRGVAGLAPRGGAAAVPARPRGATQRSAVSASRSGVRGAARRVGCARCARGAAPQREDHVRAVSTWFGLAFLFGILPIPGIREMSG